MKAITVEPQTLSWREQPTPQPQAHEVLVQVHATALNRADSMQRKGLYPPPPGASTIMGLECAGTIVELGSATCQWNIGDKVCALLAGGGFAEYVSVPENHLLPLPKHFSFAQATALPEVFATAWSNLFMHARLKANERVLIHAGASGVGTAAIQLCREFNHPCFVTVGNQDKLKFCLELGAESGWIRTQGSFLSAVHQWSPTQGVDVILDPVGAAYLADNQKCLHADGRLVLIGLMGGVTAPLNLGLMLMKRQRILGSTLRSRSDEFKAKVIQQLHVHLWPKFAQGSLQPIIDREYNIHNINTAFEYLESNQSIGKIVVHIS